MTIEYLIIHAFAKIVGGCLRRREVVAHISVQRTTFRTFLR